MGEGEERAEAAGAPRARPPRVLGPIVAAAVIALSLVRLGAIAWQTGLLVFLSLEAVVLFLNSLARARARQGSSDDS
jgi:hypothetical protein